MNVTIVLSHAEAIAVVANLRGVPALRPDLLRSAMEKIEDAYSAPPPPPAPHVIVQFGDETIDPARRR